MVTIVTKARTLHKIARLIYTTQPTHFQVLKNNSVAITEKALTEHIYTYQKIQFRPKTILKTRAHSSGLLWVMIISNSFIFVIKIDIHNTLLVNNCTTILTRKCPNKISTTRLQLQWCKRRNKSAMRYDTHSVSEHNKGIRMPSWTRKQKVKAKAEWDKKKESKNTMKEGAKRLQKNMTFLGVAAEWEYL